MVITQQEILQSQKNISFNYDEYFNFLMSLPPDNNYRYNINMETKLVSYFGKYMLSDSFNNRHILFDHCEYCGERSIPKETKLGVVCVKCGAPQ